MVSSCICISTNGLFFLTQEYIFEIFRVAACSCSSAIFPTAWYFIVYIFENPSVLLLKDIEAVSKLLIQTAPQPTSLCLFPVPTIHIFEDSWGLEPLLFSLSLHPSLSNAPNEWLGLFPLQEFTIHKSEYLPARQYVGLLQVFNSESGMLKWPGNYFSFKINSGLDLRPIEVDIS